ncbi:IS1096 element passenger TnpR family protein [Escherichia coli]
MTTCTSFIFTVKITVSLTRGGIGFPDNPFQVVIDDFEFDVGDRFTYEYNFFEHWIHDIRVEAIYENTDLKTPFCISGHGMPGATVADEFDKTLAFLEAIVNADDETTIGEIRPFADDLTLSGLTATKSTGG